MVANRAFEGKTIVTTGLDANDEEFVRKNVEGNGGTFKSSFVKSLDMLVYNPQYYKETVKMRNTKELIDKGYPIKMVTFTEFCKIVTNTDAVVDQNDPVAHGFNIENGLLIKFVEVTEDTEIIVPSSVNFIGEEAFKHCSRIKKVVIPEGVRGIGQAAFIGCETVEEIILPAGLKEIGRAAFGDCHNLISINIPDSVEKIGSQAFAGCYKLEKIMVPELVEIIDYRLFYKCESLKEISLGSKVTEIGADAFSGCKALTSVTLPNRLAVIRNMAFEECSALESITLGNNLSRIEYGAFQDCASLKMINLPERMTTLEGSVFSGCSSLEKIRIPNGVTKIDSWALMGCKNLDKLELPDSMRDISASAFYGVSEKAFNQYGNGLYLEQHGNPYYWFISASGNGSKTCEISHDTVKIAKGALSQTSGIEEIIIPKTIENLPTEINDEVKKVVFYDNLRNAQKTLEFRNANYFRELVVKSAGSDKVLRVVPVHSEIIDVARNAWKQGDLSLIDSCFGRTKSKDAKIKTSITRLMNPKGLSDQHKEQYLAYLNTNSKAVIMRAIEDDDLSLMSFMGKNGLIKKASIKTYISEATKKNAVSITAYLLEYNNQPNESISKPPKEAPKPAKKKEPSRKEWEFQDLKDGNLEIAKYKGGKKTEVEIPDTFYGQKIVSIGDYAFSSSRAKSCGEIERVIIPEGVVRIGREAFFGCNKLREIVLPSTLESIGYKAFWSCRSLAEIIIPDSVSDIDKTAFGEKGRMTLGRSAELTICARKGSYAEGYARVTGIQFKPIE